MTSHRVVTVIALTLLAGCATPPGPKAPPPGAAPPTAAFSVLAELEATGVVTAEDLCPMSPGARTYLVVDDDGMPTGATVVTSRQTRNDDGGEGRVDVEVDVGEDLTLYLTPTDDGGAAQIAVLARDQQAFSRFDPPLTLAWPELHPGAPQEAEVAMRVLDARDPRREREAGRVVRTVAYVADDRIDTPIGELLAQRVEVTFNAKLRLARVAREETIWVVPGLGIVARDDREQLTILGLPAKKERLRMVIAE